MASVVWCEPNPTNTKIVPTTRTTSMIVINMRAQRLPAPSREATQAVMRPMGKLLKVGKIADRGAADCARKC